MQSIQITKGAIMKKMIVVVFLALSAFALHAQESEWVMKAIACSSPEEANVLVPKIKTGAGEETGLCLGIIYHNLARQTPAQNIERSLALLEPLVQKNIVPLAKGYYGSALTISASVYNKKGDFATAASLVSRGCALIDEAVNAAPDSLSLRFLRAQNGLAVSEGSPIKRYEVIAEDVRILESKQSEFSPAYQALFFLTKGELRLAQGKTDEGIRCLEQAVRVAPQSSSAITARKKLALLEE
jgi:tetratricopeptide (TPR) repeat protein